MEQLCINYSVCGEYVRVKGARCPACRTAFIRAEEARLADAGIDTRARRATMVPVKPPPPKPKPKMKPDGEGKFPCTWEGCTADPFFTYKGMQSHRRRAHTRLAPAQPNGENGTFVCLDPGCKRTFKDLRYRTRHMGAIHDLDAFGEPKTPQVGLSLAKVDLPKRKRQITVLPTVADTNPEVVLVYQLVVHTTKKREEWAALDKKLSIEVGLLFDGRGTIERIGAED